MEKLFPGESGRRRRSVLLVSKEIETVHSSDFLPRDAEKKKTVEAEQQEPEGERDLKTERQRR